MGGNRARYFSLEWKPAPKPTYIERGPREKKPSSRATVYERKPNGQIVWRVCKKAEYILTVETAEGDLHEADVYSYIKNENATCRITEKFRARFESYMKQQEFMVNEHGFIYGLSKTIAVFFAEDSDVHGN